MDKKISKVLSDTLKSLNKSNIGDQITAGRIVPPPSNTLKPVIIVKPKEEE